MDVLAHLIPQTEQVEVVHLVNETTTVNFEANRLKTSKVEETAGIAVRVIKNGRLGFAASSDLTATDRLVRNALESAAYGDPVPLVFPGSQPGQDVRTFDAAIADLPVARMVEIGQEVIAYLREIDPDVLLNITLRRGVNQATIRNQTGADVAFKRSRSPDDRNQSRQGRRYSYYVDMLGDGLDADYSFAARRLGEAPAGAADHHARAGRMPVLFRRPARWFWACR